MKAVKKGFTLVELLVVLGILGVLMAVLYPATTTVRFRAAMTAVGVSGRNLYTSIVDANTARETIGYASVWPRTTTSGSESTGGGRLDIANANGGGTIVTVTLPYSEQSERHGNHPEGTE